MRRSIRPAVIAVIAVVSVVAAHPVVVTAAPCWAPPTDAPVVDPFREPACPWCPGNRGLAYGTPAGVTIRAVAAGRVTFAGDVAGTVYVVVELASGWRLTYGNLASADVARGATVVAGVVVGRTAGEFHFGLRDADGEYRDPAPYLGTWRYPPRLIPLDAPAPPPPPPTLVCATGPGADRARGVHGPRLAAARVVPPPTGGRYRSW